MLRRHHYERAFEEFLRARRIPYVAVDEARKALLPVDGAGVRAEEGGEGGSLKSFDFVIYGESTNLLVDIKGRKVTAGKGGELSAGTLQTWVTEDDIASMRKWEGLFGVGFEAAFVFVYWCQGQPPDALFQEVWEDAGEWYALRAVTLREYAAAMKPRSPKWRTVYVPAAAFARISHPFTSPAAVGAGKERGLFDGRFADAGPEVPALHPLSRPLGSGR